MSFKKLFVLSLFVFVSVALIFNFSGCAKKDRIVAKVGSLKIMGEEFKQEFIKRYRSEDAAKRQSFEERKNYLNQMIEKDLMLADAYRKGLDKKEDIVKAADEAQERTAVQQILYEKEIVDKIITEKALKDYYDKLGEEIHARHILVRANPHDSTQAEKAKVRADSIYDALKKGADFAKLAEQLSDDKANASKGGDLDYFPWGRMVDEFQTVVFAMKKGELSQPIKTPYGYHIVELLDRRKVDRKPYEEMAAQLKEELRKNTWSEMRQMADDYLANLKKDYELKINKDSLESVFKRISQPNPQSQSLFSAFSEKEREMPIATWKKGKVTVKDLDEKIGARGVGAFQSASDLEPVVEGILLPLMLTERAKETKVYNHPDAVKAGKDALEAAMVREVQKLEIDDKINFDDQTLFNYFQKNQMQYMTEPMVTIREIQVATEKQAEELLAKAQKGGDFKAMARKYNTRPETKGKAGLLGPISRSQYGRLGREAVRYQTGEFCRKPIRVDNKFSIFKVEDKVPPKAKSFDESKADVERDYRRQAKEEARKNWMEQLKKDIKVKIYDENLRKVLAFEATEAEKVKVNEKGKRAPAVNPPSPPHPGDIKKDMGGESPALAPGASPK
jgi:parvulin-like peptidyl-prolyl isomerase